MTLHYKLQSLDFPQVLLGRWIIELSSNFMKPAIIYHAFLINK